MPLLLEFLIDLFLLMGWFAPDAVTPRSRKPRASRSRDGRGWELRFPMLARVMLLILLTVVLCCPLSGLFLESPQVVIPWLVGFGIVALLVGWAVMDMVAFSLYFDDQGLTVRRFMHREIHFSWEDIKLARSPKSTFDHNFDIDLTDGRSIRLRDWLDGLGTLRQFFERHVPPERWKGVSGLLPSLDESGQAAGE